MSLSACLADLQSDRAEMACLLPLHRGSDCIVCPVFVHGCALMSGSHLEAISNLRRRRQLSLELFRRSSSSKSILSQLRPSSAANGEHPRQASKPGPGFLRFRNSRCPLSSTSVQDARSSDFDFQVILFPQEATSTLYCEPRGLLPKRARTTPRPSATVRIRTSVLFELLTAPGPAARGEGNQP